MSRMETTFARLRERGERALMPYFSAGDPSLAETRRLVAAAERAGADVVELGVPFSDPIADGPVIQRAGYRALQAGTTVRKVLEIAAQIRTRSQIPLLLFTYLNPVMRYGIEKLAADAKAAGIDGCLLTDASVEEAGAYVDVMRGAGLDTVFLAAPTSTPRRLRLVAEYSTGFVYLVSRTGVTGERNSISGAVAPLIRSMREVTRLPLAVGFGVSTPEHVAEIGSQAEAVVVGSAIMRVIEQNKDNESLEIQLESFVRELKHGFQMVGA